MIFQLLLALIVSLFAQPAPHRALNDCVTGDVIATMYPDGSLLARLPGINTSTFLEPLDWYEEGPEIAAAAQYSDVLVIMTTETVASGILFVTDDAVYIFVYADPHENPARFGEVFNIFSGDWHGSCFGRVVS